MVIVMFMLLLFYIVGCSESTQTIGNVSEQKIGDNLAHTDTLVIPDDGLDAALQDLEEIEGNETSSLAVSSS